MVRHCKYSSILYCFWAIKPQLAIARLQLHASMMSICLTRLSVCLSVAKMQKKRDFLKKKLNNLELRCLLTTYRKLCKLNWAFQRTHYWIPTIQDSWDTPSWKSTWRNLFPLRVVCLDNIAQTGAEWHVDCGDMVKIETRCRIPIWRTFGRISWQ